MNYTRKLFAILLIFVAILYTTGLLAQVKVDTFNLRSLGKSNLSSYINEYEDSTNKLSISDVVFINKNQFVANKYSEEIRIGYSESNHWLKFNILNKNNYLLSAILEIKNPSINRIQLFVEKDKFVKAYQETGDRYLFNTRNTDNRNFIYEIPLEANSDYTYYLKINTEGDNVSFPIFLYSPSEFTKKVSKEHIRNGVFYGIMIAILFSSIFLLLLNFRKPAHFYYLLYVALTGFFVLNLDGLSFQFLWPNSPWLANNMNNILSLLGTFFLIQFAIAYFDLKKHNFNFYLLAQVLSLLNLLMIFLSVLNIFSLKFIAYSIIYLMLISIITVTVFAILLYKKGPQLSIFFIIAFFSFLLSTVIISYGIFGLNIDQRENAFKIGLSIQVILLSIALSIRLRILSDIAHKAAVNNLEELNKYKEEANKKLEVEVKNRTESLVASNEKYLNAVIEIGNKNTKMHQQRIEILKQQQEIENKNQELEKIIEENYNKNKELAKRNTEIKKQKDQIEIQKNELEKKNQDITDSINYAERIQSSIIPSEGHVSRLLDDYFILFKPKDILSGDFFWIDRYPPETHNIILKSKQKRKIIVAAVDCTGHGIPGAIMSIIGKDQLDRAIFQYGLTKPGDILATLNQGVSKAMSYTKSGISLKDGMDISIVCFDPEKFTLDFAAANHQMYLVRDSEIIKYAGDRKSIGGGIDDNMFVHHNIALKKNDIIYMFSDGFVDQFGGEHNKKFKYTKFKDLLLKIHNEPPLEQREILYRAHEEWKGESEQVDDILIIGIKF